ncbi:hypothetical protein HDU79_001044 [Rhizoclosmatium sp. JEL0117]|nr:hypothetical protein HDU79_001044 [Rhizoclosmatium sp. JEL0117]
MRIFNFITFTGIIAVTVAIVADSANALNEKVAPANKRDDYTYRTQRCGLDWYDANSQCGAFCTDNSYCRDGKGCYAGLDASPCATWESDPNNGYHDHTGNGGGQGHRNDGSKRCGVDWPDASRRCGYCRDNSDCLGSQTCFGGLDARQCRYDGDQQNGGKGLVGGILCAVFGCN